VLRLGIPDRFVDHGKRELLLDQVGLSAEHVAARAIEALNRPAGILVAEGG
jgi:deoxyxylulose-5-phosphate synthase